jgi:hypothetical protein
MHEHLDRRVFDNDARSFGHSMLLLLSQELVDGSHD